MAKEIKYGIEARKALEAGRFGKLSHGSIHVRWNRNRDYYDQAKWRGTWAQDGGALPGGAFALRHLLRHQPGQRCMDVAHGHPQLRCDLRHDLLQQDLAVLLMLHGHRPLPLYHAGKRGEVSPPTFSSTAAVVKFNTL